MKKNFLILASLVAIATACSKSEGERTGTSIVDEWVPIKIVRQKVETPINSCNKQSKVIITKNHFTYYEYWKENQDCKSQIDEYDYIIDKENGKSRIKKDGEFHYYYYALEDNGAHLRLTNLIENSYTIFKRK
ncbi:lipocalin family protein [Capnocytophaga sp. oral taxon 338]|uniref:lipocalin family protein n=1 Tax=Capnocytophaga sp. oral taxon 338 TaxID=710239 RepID=UPI000202DBE3|nr:lipocalin family protein [Capnocytophaga sp. oral taxon 338]EGD33376.1 hypothetical protein HMPREF9071_2170 [Capnocytophaga sp. oral taxon 338 str. F0234]